MIKFLAKTFIKDSENVSDKNVRKNYSVLGGIVGAVCNHFLFALKLAVGTLMHSIAVTSDAFNNLSDMGSCLVAIIGAGMSTRLPDREHPYGHGRIEYISSLIVSFIILLVGFELFKSSVDKISNPENVIFSLPMIIILAASVLVKLWMYFCYSFIAKKINSTVMKATARDSINDVISTSAVVLATVIGSFLPVPIDGFVGIAVAAYIIYGGYNLAKETIDLLLGTPPSRETIDSLSRIIMSREEIVGIHDLMVHDYGPGRVFASVHAEVPDDSNMVHIHEVIDDVERQILSKTGIQTVIHTDPITVNNDYVDGLKTMVLECAQEIFHDCTIHDFRITDGENRINLIFDLVLTDAGKPSERDRIVSEIKKNIIGRDERFNTVITVDEDYSGR